MKFFPVIRLMVAWLLCLPFGINAQTIYTIGGHNPDFFSFPEAVAFLESTTLTETVIFNVRDGFYDQPFRIPEIAGTSADNQIIFQSESGNRTEVRIQGFPRIVNENVSALVWLDGADHVVFNELTFEHFPLPAEPPRHVTIIGMYEQAYGNVIKNCYIHALPSEEEVYLIEAAQGAFVGTDTELRIENNELEGGVIGINLSNNAERTNIHNNTIVREGFSHETTYGIKGDTFYDLSIKKNRIEEVTTAIHLTDAVEDLTIEQNRLQKLSGVGLYTNNTHSFDTSLNTIIRNNWIELTTGNEQPVLELREVRRILVCNNTLNVNNTRTNAQAIKVNLQVGETYVFNNLITNLGSGTIGQLVFPGLTYSEAFNNLFPNNFNGTNFPQNSEGEPIFTNFDPYFLSDNLMPQATPLRESGKTLPEITNDINEMPRLDPSGIGAINIERQPYEAGIEIAAPVASFAAGENAIQVTLTNHGREHLTAATFNWSVDEAMQTEYEWTGNLAPDASEIITLGTFDFMLATDYALNVTVTLPTEHPDSYPPNNEININNLTPGLGGAYTIGEGGDFSNLTNAFVIIQSGGIYADVTLNILAGTYDGFYELDNFVGSDEYELTIQSASQRAEDVTLRSNVEEGSIFFFEQMKRVSIRHLTFVATQERGEGIVGIAIEQVTVENNIFSTFGTAIALAGGQQILIADNQINLDYITDTDLNDSTQGIALSQCIGSFQIVRNQMKISSSYGVYISGQVEDDPSTNQERIIANNYIQVIPQYYSRLGSTALSIVNIRDVQLVYNTLRIDAFITFLIHLGATTNCIVKNNLLQAISEPYIYRIENNQWDELDIDNNIVSTERAHFAYVDNGQLLSFTDWQNTTDLSTQSKFHQTLFIAPDTYRTYDPEANNLGTPIPNITTDIEGNPRDPDTPDVGAFEFTPPANDAGITEVFTPTAPFAAGSYPLDVRLKNFGTDNLQSVEIHYSVNDVKQPVFQWTGDLPSQQIRQLTLAAVPFVDRMENVVKVWTELPNGLTDNLAYNDTMTIDKIYTGLNGHYSVYGENADFIDLTTAVEVLHLAGVMDSVFFDIADGEYTEQIEIEQIKGASAMRRVTFQSASLDSTKVVFNYQDIFDTKGIFTLTNVSHIHFHALTFSSTLTTFFPNKYGLLWKGGGDYNSITSCQFIDPFKQVVHVAFSTFEEEIYNHNQIENNSFVSGHTALSFSNTSRQNNVLNVGNEIINNHFQQFTRTFYFKSQKNGRISRNRTESTGFGMGNSVGVTINDNIITSDRASSTVLALYNNFATAEADNTPSLIYNNFIQNINDNDFREVTGIYLEGRNVVKLIHNTVKVTGGDSRFEDTHALELVDVTSETVIKNNVFSNRAPFIVNLIGDRNDLPILDNNAYYGANDFFTSFGIYDETSVDDLDAWKSTTQLDQNSVVIDPFFSEEESYSVQNTALQQVTDPQEVAFAATDIEGQARDGEYPTAGVYELTPLTTDLSMLKFSQPTNNIVAGSQPVQIEIRNAGINPITAFSVTWQLNGETQPTTNWTGNLASGETLLFDLGQAYFTDGTTYELQATATLTDGSTDEFLNNNTVTRSNIIVRLGGIYTVGGEDADFTNIQQAVQALQNIGVAAPVTFSIRPGTYNLRFILNDFIGMGSEHPVYFENAGNIAETVLISTSSGRNLFREENFALVGVENIHFNRLNFVPDFTTSANNAVRIGRDSKNISFRYCEFNMDDTNDELLFMEDVGAGILVEYCKFYQGRTGVKADLFFNPSTEETLITLRHNEFIGTLGASISISNVSADILNNQVQNNTPTDECGYFDEVIGIEVSGFNTKYGKIIGNRIFVACIEAIGIKLEHADLNLIANNLIHVRGTAMDRDVFGISLYNSTSRHIIHNTIIVNGTNHDNAVIDANSESIIEHFQNNLIQTKSMAKIFEFSSTQFETSSFDNNIYHLADGHFAYFDTEDISDLTAWQTATNLDQNSFALDPAFNNETTFFPTNVAVQDLGQYTDLVTTDINGRPRSTTTPDAGIYENTAACFPSAPDNTAPTLECFTNYVVSFTDGVPDPILPEDLIAEVSDDCAAAVDLTYSFAATDATVATYDFNCNDLNENSTAKLFVSDAAGNQTFCAVGLNLAEADQTYCECTHTDITITGTSADWEATRYRAERTISTNTIVNDNENLVLHAQESITMTAGFTVATGGTFTATIENCLEAPDFQDEVTERNLEENVASTTTNLTIAPTPTTGSLAIRLDQPNLNIAPLAIFNTTGEQVWSGQIMQEHTLNLQYLPTGMYILVVKSVEETLTRRFVIAR